MHVTGNLMRNVYSERLRGYKDALQDFGIPFSQDLLIVNYLGLDDGINVAANIVNMEDRPDAVFVANDGCAVACMQELKKHGIRIPEDIAFAGFNNDPISKVIEPNLTTISYKGEEMGEFSASILFGLLKGNKNIAHAQTVVLRHQLVIRESSLKSGSASIITKAELLER